VIDAVALSVFAAVIAGAVPALEATRCRTALVMIAVGFLAALGPTVRCLRIEPTEALREQ
jgi:hypothetical protein